MPRKVLIMTREEIIAALTNIAKKLGKTPSYKDFTTMTPVSDRLIKKHFASYTRLIEESGVESRGHGNKLQMETLLSDWAQVARKLKKIPNAGEYAQSGTYSHTPFRMRFGPWPQMPAAFQRYVESKGRAEEWKDVLQLIEEHEAEEKGARGVFMPKMNLERTKSSLISPVIEGKPMYGAPARQSALAYCPLNELGVVFLFGTIADEMGYMVTRLQTEFPDCEAMRQVGDGKWQRVRVEFEYESRNFIRHGHKIEDCDVIVCWFHNWDDCPLEVVELRKVWV